MADSVSKIVGEMDEALTGSNAGDPITPGQIDEWRSRLAALDGWRPISEAPKSLDEIAKLFPDSLGTTVLIGRARKTIGKHAYIPGVVGECTLRDGKWVAPTDPALAEISDNLFTEIADATHWQPLPRRRRPNMSKLTDPRFWVLLIFAVAFVCLIRAGLHDKQNREAAAFACATKGGIVFFDGDLGYVCATKYELMGQSPGDLK